MDDYFILPIVLPILVFTGMIGRMLEGSGAVYSNTSVKKKYLINYCLGRVRPARLEGLEGKYEISPYARYTHGGAHPCGVKLAAILPILELVGEEHEGLSLNHPTDERV